ncbi:MAG: peptide chain release factor N(5)-glutamine methyltransferase [bacterium]|nr:peptide chain release factor N(5)-glutamine methyltransferase [bacterium]
MVIRELLRELSACCGENGEFEARELFMHASGMTMTEVVLNRGSEVDAETEDRVRQLVKRRISGEPLQYITGTAEFMGLEFMVNQYTLIPRQDTETLVEKVMEYAAEGAKILDIGTGSGCIGISLAKYVRNAEVTLSDISVGALDTAKKNAENNGVSVNCVRLDILREIPEGKFDIVVSNPPYIETEIIKELDANVRDYEPLSALDGGADGLLFYRRITDIAPGILKDGGMLAYEIGYNQGEAAGKIVRKVFGNAQVIKDLCGNDRVIIAKKNG